MEMEILYGPTNEQKERIYLLNNLIKGIIKMNIFTLDT